MGSLAMRVVDSYCSRDNNALNIRELQENNDEAINFFCDCQLIHSFTYQEICMVQTL